MKLQRKLLLLLLSTTLLLSGCGPSPTTETEPTPKAETPTPAASEPSGLEAELAKITLKDLTATELLTADDWKTTKYPLLAQLPEEDIALYGYHINDSTAGVILRSQDHLQTFTWEYITPRLVLPQMKQTDFDGDGQEELGIILYVGSGTGYSVKELHILKPDNQGVYVDYFFMPSDYQTQINEKINHRYDENAKTMTFTAEEEQVTFDSSQWFQQYPFQDITYSDMIDFVFEEDDRNDNEKDLLREKEGEEIEMIFAPGFLQEGMATPQYYVDDFTAEVRFDGSHFTLTDFDLE